MNVHLTDEQREFVQRRVASGGYASASEVIRAGLRALEEEERWRESVRQKIADGIAQAKVGELLDGDQVFKEIMDRVGDHRNMNP
ncbi:MAG TPA: type II toxin-antitoxin system ParD family antitoxin [Phycisphaerae bacterium]|nr:type II toxin-antitoxin system ParD family antitoxin [Phycisphaerae bacterium]